ncbi:MAG TPA: flavocytochrome c, partial [Treponemataceae bacterium]|nr:flavocytochrome c [Treponemataceae bacterium]
IGAGGAGMAAGVSAHQNGATVIILEKMPKVGGNTISAGGAMNAVDDGSETALKNKDSVALHYKRTFEGGDKKGDEALVKTLVENAWDSVAWLQSMGMKFLPDPFTVTGGLWPRAHKPVDPVGTGFFKTYNAYIESNKGIEVRLNVKADSIILENGKVTGVIATGKTGNKITVKANKGVVVATGGFGQNIAMRQEFNKAWPTLDESVKSTNHPGATGDGIAMAKAVNAQLVQMENIQLLPLGDPETGSLSGNIETDVEKRIFVNTEGKRFVDEGARRDTMTLALFKQPGAKLWIIVDAHSYPQGTKKNNFNESIDDLVAAGRAFKGETLEELAKNIGVPPENLVATVADFNKHVASKKPDAFGRTLFSEPLDKGPFYAGARIPTVHHTMGGIKIDKETHVIDVNGQIIPGLYAAGEVTGGIHGTNRLGGNALTDITVFGRIAGKNAAAGK